MVLSTPTFPFVIPPIDRKNKACQNEVEKAKPTQDSTSEGTESAKAMSTRLLQHLHVPTRPIINTALRPTLPESAIRPQSMAVKNWAAVKLALKNDTAPVRSHLCTANGGDHILQDASLAGNNRVREGRVEPFELVKHVGLDGGLDERFTQPRQGDDTELVFAREISPRDRLPRCCTVVGDPHLVFPAQRWAPDALPRAVG